MNVLMISENLMKGGKERRMIEYLRSLEYINEDISVKLVILKNVVEYNQVYHLKKTELLILPRKIKKDPLVFFKLLKLSNKFKPELIHSWGSMSSVYAAGLSFLKKIPLINGMVVDAKCDVFSQNWIRARISFPFSKIIIGNSQAGLHAYGAKGKRAMVIYNGFNKDRLNNIIDKSVIRKNYKIKSEYVVGMIAAFHPRKDYGTYLEVAKEVVMQRGDITFLAIGQGSQLDYYMGKYQDFEQIIFTGNIDHVESVINCLNIGVLLSNSHLHKEGISNAILEMMAFAKPVIATRDGGTSEIIDNGRNGFTIDHGDKKTLKKTIIDLIEDDELNKEIGKKAQEKIFHQFSIESMSKKYLNLYFDIINTKKCKPENIY